MWFIALAALLALNLMSCSKDNQSELLNGILLSGCNEETGLPIVADASIESESGSAIVIGSAVTEECGSAVTEYGVCYSISTLPTVDDMNVSSGAGMGPFTATLEGLQQFTTYHARPYAINAKGVTYGAEISFMLKIEVGQLGPAGGLIFYDKGQYTDGWRYLEAAPVSTEWTFIIYGCPGTNIGTSASIGAGLPNSEAFLTRCGSVNAAAGRCMGLDHNGFDDWFLPSIDELQRMYSNLHLQFLGNFGTTSYWSSTDISGNYARGINFSTGLSGQGMKTDMFRVRAARRF